MFQPQYVTLACVLILSAVSTASITKRSYSDQSVREYITEVTDFSINSMTYIMAFKLVG